MPHNVSLGVQIMQLCSDILNGTDHFCPALAKAVKTMKKGEKVQLTVKPQYGFGEKGKPTSSDGGAVPPNATLQLGWSHGTVSNITDDKKVLKILKEGQGYEKPNEGAVVKLKLTGKLLDGSLHKEGPWWGK
ncbi:hypothetical protein RND71_043153 [Anisodus tanguticus]|uniref:peptidylprolyl isomerase n=1 Tax=Anisodus tanguticus TaxID=243964 RepID=A0AAE1UT00_9SOLA|nr:hypothetical protein RND71_043153 [Anisodus tanguticus]